MDKLIKDLESIISDYRSSDILNSSVKRSGISDYLKGTERGRNDVSCAVFRALNRYKIRQQRAAESYANEISSNQWHQIKLLIDRAAEMWSNMVDLPSDIMYYRFGFIDAVILFCRILGIDETCVKK